MAAILGPLFSYKKLNFEQYLLNTHWYYTLQIHGITPRCCIQRTYSYHVVLCASCREQFLYRLILCICFREQFYTAWYCAFVSENSFIPPGIVRVFKEQFSYRLVLCVLFREQCLYRRYCECFSENSFSHHPTVLRLRTKSVHQVLCLTK